VISEKSPVLIALFNFLEYSYESFCGNPFVYGGEETKSLIPFLQIYNYYFIFQKLF
jgi:hypothetical protein